MIKMARKKLSEKIIKEILKEFKHPYFIKHKLYEDTIVLPDFDKRKTVISRGFIQAYFPYAIDKHGRPMLNVFIGLDMKNAAIRYWYEYKWYAKTILLSEPDCFKKLYTIVWDKFYEERNF